MVNQRYLFAALFSVCFAIPALAETERHSACLAYEHRSNWFELANDVGQVWQVPPSLVLAFIDAETTFLDADRVTALPGTKFISDAVTLSSRPELTIGQVSEADWARFAAAYGSYVLRGPGLSTWPIFLDGTRNRPVFTLGSRRTMQQGNT